MTKEEQFIELTTDLEQIFDDKYPQGFHLCSKKNNCAFTLEFESPEEIPPFLVKYRLNQIYKEKHPIDFQNITFYFTPNFYEFFTENYNLNRDSFSSLMIELFEKHLKWKSIHKIEFT